ncbi:RNA polymerase sigma factor [Lysobacter helvus]|uniref:RNA polymerase sigma factor n=2 Tax=Lysobacteraceae TaxID=32033 RepID=A0ABM7Q8T5_9GAMM|nr:MULTISPECIES: sigma-70 family RNA polymerase sigma factor [Lysobacter]BCT93810.1 RNA polymerase sigma factor [Lysobacter caseinilyticus]BCT96966.1 RNA polymerase sigma factor [Lysobacter helvus]
MIAAILPFPRPEPPRAMLEPEAANQGVASRTAPADSGPAWAALMTRAQDGDRDAYHALLIDITPYLRAIAARYLGRDETEDAVQEILLVVHDIRHTWERARPFKPWLSTIATRRCIDMLRSRSRRIERELLSDDPFEPFEDDAPGPEASTERAHAARALHDAVDELSPRQREAVRLLHLRDLSLSEASTQSQQSIGSLKVAAHRAIKALRDSLGGKDGPHG